MQSTAGNGQQEWNERVEAMEDAAQQLHNVQALLQDHIVALERACDLGRHFERALASLNTRAISTPVAPSSIGSVRAMAPSSLPRGRRTSGTGAYPQREFAGQGVLSERVGSPACRGQEESVRQIVRRKTFAVAESSSRVQELTKPLVTNPSIEGEDVISEVKPETRAIGRFVSTLEVKHGRAQERLRRKGMPKSGEEGDEESLYKKDGFAQCILRHRVFKIILFVAILANTIWAGFEVDLFGGNASYANVTCQRLNNVFAVIFSVEIVMRLCAFERKCDAWRHVWFTCDLVLCLQMAWSCWADPLLHLCGISGSWGAYTYNISCLRVLRIARVARVAFSTGRLPELMAFSTGIIEGLKAVLPLLSLLGLVVYVFGVALTVLLSDTIIHFDSVPHACHYLFLSALGEVEVDAFVTMLAAGWLPWCLFTLYMLIGNLVVAKMVMGVLLEVVMRIVQNEREKESTDQLERTIRKVAQTLDTNGNGTLSRDEFEQLVEDVALRESMAAHEVDVVGFIDFTLYSFPQDGELRVSDLILFAKQFCGAKPVYVKDMMTLRQMLNLQLASLRRALQQDNTAMSPYEESIYWDRQQSGASS